MVNAQIRTYPKKWDEQNSPGFWDTNWSSHLEQKTNPSINLKPKINCHQVDFTVPENYRQ